MVNCPVCQAEIEEDFGLVTCSSCGSQVLLEFDGGAVAPLAQSAEPNSANMVDDLSQVLFSEIDETPTQAFELPSVELKAPTSSDMSDVADFGNSERSIGREGMLRFNLFIAGIDTVDIREEVREALVDEKFLWDADQVMSTIKNGELTIKEVTPVKSAILLQRLRTIPVDIRWEQYAIHQV